MSESLQLMLALALLIVAAKSGGWLSLRLGQPAVLGELSVGVLLGPSVLDLLHLPLFTSEHLGETVLELAEIGVILLMFYAGLEISLQDLIQSGRVSLLAGVAGVVAPLALGLGTALLFGFGLTEAALVGVILTATSVSISAQTLLELGVLGSRAGLALLGAAVVDDVLGILILSIFTALAGAGSADRGLIEIVFRMAFFLVVGTVVSFWLLPRLAVRISRTRVSQGLLVLGVAAALLLAVAAEVIGGVAAITGAFMAGIALARSELQPELARSVSALGYGFFVPLFFVSIGLLTDARAIALDQIPFIIVVTLVAVVSKIGGCGLGALWAGFDRRAALQVGCGMVSRGEVGLIVATVGISSGIIGPDLFAITVVVVLATTLVTPLLLRWSFAGEPGERSPA